MNIVVRTANGHTVVRPDTSWERYNRDFYVPDFVNGLSWASVIYTQIIRPGKFIGPNFTERYYEGLAFGLLLYPDAGITGPEAFAQACCLNHTSILPCPLPDAAGQHFVLYADGEKLFDFDATNGKSILEDALVQCSKWVLLRNGDLLAAEIGAAGPLPKKAQISIKGYYEEAPESPLLDLNIIME